MLRVVFCKDYRFIDHYVSYKTSYISGIASLFAIRLCTEGRSCNTKLLFWKKKRATGIGVKR